MRFNDMTITEPLYGVTHGHIDLFSFHDIVRLLKISSFKSPTKTHQSPVDYSTQLVLRAKNLKQVSFLGFSEIKEPNTILGVFRLECPIALNLNEPPTEHRTPKCAVIGEFRSIQSIGKARLHRTQRGSVGPQSRRRN